MFWRVDEDLYNLPELHKRIPDFIRVATERHRPPEDMDLLHQCAKHMYVLRRLRLFPDLSDPHHM